MMLKPGFLKHRRLVWGLAFVVALMFGFGFALVPIYNVMCKQLYLNGKITGGPSTEIAATVDNTRTVTVEFIANNNEQLPWDFFPNIKKVVLHPGETTHISFHAANTTDHLMKVQAIPSVAPGIAARYLKKTECFCFSQQQLDSHQSMDMPITFHLDPALPKDIHTITLSYTLFDITGQQLGSGGKPVGRIGA